MPLEIRAWKFAVPLVGTLFLAAACSSSDSPSGFGDNRLSQTESRTFFDTASDVATNDIDETNIVLRSVDAAEADVLGLGDTGGVSQASGTTAFTATPEIVIDVDSDNDRTTFNIQIGDYTIDTRVNAAGSNTDTTSMNAVDNTGLMQTPPGPAAPGTSGNADVVTFVQEQANGNLYLWLSADKPRNERGRGSVGGDDDYLAYGFWIYDPAGAPATANPAEIGVFVDGTAAFDGNLVALSGTAEYLGKAEGLYYELVSGAEDHDVFLADARFEVNFDPTDLADVANIDGAIDNFRFSDAARTTQFEDFVVRLEREGNTPGPLLISSASAGLDGGFFETGRFAGANGFLDVTAGGGEEFFVGAWGGKFYGDAVSATVGYPETVAGTFGVRHTPLQLTSTSPNDRWSLLGAFWADYHPDPPDPE